MMRRVSRKRRLNKYKPLTEYEIKNLEKRIEARKKLKMKNPHLLLDGAQASLISLLNV